MKVADTPLERWRGILDALLKVADTPGSLPERLRNEVFELQQAIQWDFFRGVENIEPNDPRLRIVLDALDALSVTELDEPSHAWNRAGLLHRARRYLEAADDYLVAASRLEADATAGTGLTGDESDWAHSALHHAATNLALGGHPASAAALLHRLTPEARDEVEPLIRRSVAAS